VAVRYFIHSYTHSIDSDRCLDVVTARSEMSIVLIRRPLNLPSHQSTACDGRIDGALGDELRSSRCQNR
jgi:hypothetical protein